jgi:hypothetical protein
VEKVALTLERPSLALLPSFRAALAEEQAEGNYLDLTPEGLPAHIAALLARSHDVKPGRVPETVYWGVVDGEYIGRVSLRHVLNPHLEQWGGHIGYQVRPSRRGRGYTRCWPVCFRTHALWAWSGRCCTATRPTWPRPASSRGRAGSSRA